MRTMGMMAALALLSGCGGEDASQIDSKNAPSASSAQTAVVQPGTPTATEVPAATMGDDDLVGIRLGMTPDEVTSALKAHNAELTITPARSYLTYAIGVENRRASEDYIQNLRAEAIDSKLNRLTEAFEITFSSPPLPVRAISVYRVVHLTDPKTMSGTGGPYTELRASLTQKYEEPTFDRSRLTGAGPNTGGKLDLWWHLSEGKPACFGPADFTYTGRPIQMNLAQRFLVQKMKSDCGAFVHYEVEVFQGAVRTVSADLFDPGAAVASIQATSEFLKEQADGAMAEDAESGKAPTL